MRTIVMVFLASSSLLAAAACATNPATGRRELMLISEAQEIQMGRESDAQVRKSMGVYNDPKWQRYVTDVGMRLARQSHRPNLPWTFTVVDEPAVNAFALPGGFVYITRGLLPYLRDEAELACVLGHEVGHVDARHSASQVSKQQVAGLGVALGTMFAPKYVDAFGLANSGLGLLFLKFGRADELEADQLGTGYAARAGWDPAGMPGLLDTLARLDEASGSSRGVPNWALTHPPAPERVEKVQDAVAAARSPTSTARNRPAFEEHLPGLVYGDSREKGFVRGREFVHPVLRVAVTFPEGWDIANSDDAVTAQAPGSETSILFQPVGVKAGNLRTAAENSMLKSGFEPVGAPRVDSIHGLDAFVGTFEGTIERVRAAAQAGFVRLPSNEVYRIVGLAAASQFDAVRGPTDSTIASFREMSQREADAIQNRTVTFYSVKNGDTWESIAAASGGAVKASSLAIMNGATIDSPPRPGSRLRGVR